jgi:hypothetical protein
MSNTSPAMAAPQVLHGASPPEGLTRRELLKLATAGLIGSLFPLNASQITAASPEQHGRILEAKINLFDLPSLRARPVATYWKDTILPIREITLGDDEPVHNRVWYFTGEGYAHSGSIQPVDVKLNPPQAGIPAGGALAVITVPFTDAHWGVGVNSTVAYRLYYETTHWVAGLHHDREGQPWYEIAEDKWQLNYYAPAAHLRLISSEELMPIAVDLHPLAKRIEVLTTPQAIVAYELDRPVFIAKTATGARFSNGDFSTPPGRHFTKHKRPSRHMAAGNLAFNGYDLPGVPWISYITESGISFHGTYWHNNFGRPRSHGCINLTPKAAHWIYRWTLPYVPSDQQVLIEETGTIVDVL